MITRTLACWAGLALACPTLAQSTWYVDIQGTPPGTGSLSDPYTSIQYAIDAPTTSTGDTLSVAPGTYPEAIRFHGKSLAIVGDVADHPTISAAGIGEPVVTCMDGEPASPRPRLENLVLAEGSGLPYGFGTAGAGVYLEGSSLTMVRCYAQDLAADRGGFLFAKDATLVLTDCEFLDQFHPYGPNIIEGGTLYADASDVAIDGCRFTGMYVWDEGSVLYMTGGSLTLTDSVLEECHTVDYRGALAISAADVSIENTLFLRCSTAYGQGGSLAWSGGFLSVRDCQFLGGGAADGGAVALWSGTADFRRCTFSGLDVEATYFFETGNGGAAYVTNALATFLGCLFVDNSAAGHGTTDSPGEGGAVFGPATLHSCTVIDNVAGGPSGGPGSGGATRGAVAIRDCIVRNNSPDNDDPSAAITYSDVEGGAAGTGNIDADPLFVSAPDDLRLLAGSPCIDAGDPDSPLDTDGSRVDMGARPYVWLPIGARYCVANANSSGGPASIEAYGSSIPIDNWLRLASVGLPAGQFGYCLMSESHAFVPFFGGSEGILCLGPPQYRFNHPPTGEVLFSGTSGRMDYRPDLTNLPSGVVFQAGATWSFQLWFRDVATGGGNTSNTSDGVDVTWQ